MEAVLNVNKQEAVIARLRGEIARGEHGVTGEPFMTVRNLAEEFNVALATAQKIVNRLKEEGILESRYKRLRIASRDISDHLEAPCRIALLVTNVDNPFFSRLINAVELSGRRRKVEVVTAGSDYNCEHEKSQLEMLRSSGADGFLIAPAHDEMSVANLKGIQIPFVLIGRQVHGIDCDVVMVNDFEAGRMAAQHLIQQGCRKFFYIGLNNFQIDRRRDGYIFELSQHGYKINPEMLIYTNVHGDDNSLQEQLGKMNTKFKTGIFCYHDMLAIRTMRQIRINHLNIPEQVSVIGMDNLPIATEVFPSLSSIDYPISQIAENAVEILLRRIKYGVDNHPSVNYIAPRLIKRESSY